MWSPVSSVARLQTSNSDSENQLPFPDPRLFIRQKYVLAVSASEGTHEGRACLTVWFPTVLSNTVAYLDLFQS